MTLLVSHPVRSSLKLAREARRPHVGDGKLKSVTAVTSHVPTAPYVAAHVGEQVLSSHATRAARSCSLVAKMFESGERGGYGDGGGDGGDRGGDGGDRGGSGDGGAEGGPGGSGGSGGRDGGLSRP